MVEQLLEVWGGDVRSGRSSTNEGASRWGVDVYHVDARFSDDVGDIGHAGWRKIGRLLKYCAEAIGCRLRFGVTDFLYIPAPGMRAPLYRDWMILMLCRPFFRRRIYYWQAAGLSQWLEEDARLWERRLSRWLLGRPAVSIVLGEYCRADGEYFSSGTVAVVPNAIPDPCPDYDRGIAAERALRAGRRTASLVKSGGTPEIEIYRVLFIGLCTREKGLFDAMEAIGLANRELASRGSGVRIQLNVAGKFWREEERREFDERLKQPDLAGSINSSGEPAVRYVGFVGGGDKRRLFTDCDCMCFPTFYPAESFGIVLIEAMAFGMQIVTTRWRTIPELFPKSFTGLVEPRYPSQLAAALLAALETGCAPSLREHFLSRFTREQFARNITNALMDR